MKVNEVVDDVLWSLKNIGGFACLAIWPVAAALPEVFSFNVATLYKLSIKEIHAYFVIVKIIDGSLQLVTEQKQRRPFS
jgi:hypothetical protein